MTSRAAFKRELKKIDRSTRLCLLYLENTIDEKFKLALKVKTPVIPKVDFSLLEPQFDSLQKQINGLRQKVDIAQKHILIHDESEKAIKILVSRADQVLDQVQKQFKEIYDSGYYSEGMKRKIRDAGLIHE